MSPSSGFRVPILGPIPDLPLPDFVVRFRSPGSGSLNNSFGIIYWISWNVNGFQSPCSVFRCPVSGFRSPDSGLQIIRYFSPTGIQINELLDPPTNSVSPLEVRDGSATQPAGLVLLTISHWTRKTRMSVGKAQKADIARIRTIFRNFEHITLIKNISGRCTGMRQIIINQENKVRQTIGN